MLAGIARLRRAQEGFTLIELLVVVAIIALLATFAVPKLFEAINKSKAAPGQADMNTLSSAMERHYFDKNNYPSGTAAQVKEALIGGYVKSSTTFANGFKNGYAYFSNGSYYILVDAGNNRMAITVTCGTSSPWTGTATIVEGDFVVGTATSTPDVPTATQLNACVVSSSTAGFDASQVKLITN